MYEIRLQEDCRLNQLQHVYLNRQYANVKYAEEALDSSEILLRHAYWTENPVEADRLFLRSIRKW